MKNITSNENGFTAVELLITLIVASMFLFAGYQIYNQVTMDGGNATREAIVSNKVYEKLRQKALDPSISGESSCASNDEVTSPPSPETIPGVGSVSFITEVTCPNIGDSIDTYRIKIRATYNDSGINKSIEHATYVN